MSVTAAGCGKEAHRLPAPGGFRWLGGPLGDLVLRPWFDRVALYSVADWLFPLSRGWASALEAADSPQRFCTETGLALGGKRLARLLSGCAAAHADYEQAAKRWEQAYFGSADPGAVALVEAELTRRATAQDFMGTRRLFLPWRRRLPAVRWAVAGPQVVRERHGHRLASEDAAFPAPAEVRIERSREVVGGYGPEYWLRFPSPSAHMDDTAWCHVYEPAGPARATLIFLHGIAMETEFWRNLADPMTELAGRGIRVMRPEGPWHGRRRPRGWFGGEPAIGQGPLGFIELFKAWIGEIASFIAWARRQGDGPVIVGGVSLGALTSQLLGAVCRGWPAEMKPDLLFLVATTGEVPGLAFQSSLARAVGLPPHLQAAGWSPAVLEPFLPLIEPMGPPGIPPERIVAVLGDRDDLTLYEGGQALVRRWRLPPENVFVKRQGHFSVALGLERDRRPIDRLEQLVAAFAAGE